MKKFFYFLSFGLFLFSPIFVQAQSNTGLKDILISEEVKAVEDAGTAKTEAGRLLDSAPKRLQIKGVPIQPIKRKAPEKDKTVEIIEKYGEGPFGLAWGTSNSYTRNTGVILEDISDDNNPRTFNATFLPKPIPDFEKVTVSFGRDNKLWRIIAYGRGIEDNEKANGVLREYNKYARMLEKKYGKRKEEFTPKVTRVEKVIELEDDKTETIIELIESKIGGERFYEELKNEETSLYSTFTDGTLGIVLSIGVYSNGETYIVIDYKNIKILEEQEQATFDAL